MKLLFTSFTLRFFSKAFVYCQAHVNFNIPVNNASNYKAVFTPTEMNENLILKIFYGFSPIKAMSLTPGTKYNVFVLALGSNESISGKPSNNVTLVMGMYFNKTFFYHYLT